VNFIRPFGSGFQTEFFEGFNIQHNNFFVVTTSCVRRLLCSLAEQLLQMFAQPAR
jgi:hypothetical protein